LYFFEGKYSRGSPHYRILFNLKININLYKEIEYTTNQPTGGLR
jgi:hypothetical protein